MQFNDANTKKPIIKIIFMVFINGSVVNHGAAMAMTTALGRPISLLPMKNTALSCHVSGCAVVKIIR